MQVVDHITICPLLNQERGLEPYPQPLVCFTSAVSGTVQVRIYDTSVQPMVELTTSALSGAELSAVTATGLTYAYTLDMGHANVTSVVDLMTREGFEGVVMFEDSGGTGEKIYVKISANTPEQVAFLYPDNAIYLDRNATSTGTNFPDGSIFRPVNLIADACSLVTSRGADVLDVVGQFTPSTDEWTNAKLGSSLVGKQIRCRPGKSARIDSQDNAPLNMDGCHIKGFNKNLNLRNDTNSANSSFAGGILVEDCSLHFFVSQGSTGVAPVLKNCRVDQMSQGRAEPAEWIDCEFNTNGYLNLNFYQQGRTVKIIRPSGIKLQVIGNYRNSTSNTVSITDVKGMLPIHIYNGVRNGTKIVVTGAYGDLQVDGLSHAQPPILEESKVAAVADLTGNVVNLAAGSITPTEAPNLDVAVSSVSGGGGGTDWTTTEKSQIRHRLSLDGTHAVPTSTHGDIYDLTTRLTAARAGNLDNLDAASSTLATSSALTAAAADIATLLTRIGSDDMAILKGLSLGNYVLDGGPGAPTITYDANDHASTMRFRVFDSSSNTSAATFGASSPEAGEIGTVTITSTPTAGKAYPAQLKGVLT
tara:strand:+ start:638 stop:2401 length:1764 start_codon:yes stop_codon:yes gene_type:complete